MIINLPVGSYEIYALGYDSHDRDDDSLLYKGSAPILIYENQRSSITLTLYQVANFLTTQGNSLPIVTMMSADVLVLACSE